MTLLLLGADHVNKIFPSGSKLPLKFNGADVNGIDTLIEFTWSFDGYDACKGTTVNA